VFQTADVIILKGVGYVNSNLEVFWLF